MPTIRKFNVTFDGTNPVDQPNGGVVQWFGGWMGYYDGWYSGPKDRLNAFADLTGSNWQIKTLRLAADDNKTTLRDLDNGADRRIDFLELGWNSDVELISTRVRFIFGWDGNRHVVTLGDQQNGSTAAINLYAATNIVTTGNAYVGIIETGGTDTITIGSGGAGYVQTGHGHATVTTNGDVEFVKTGDGNDTVNINGFATALRTKAGNDEVNVNGTGYAELIRTHDGNDTVTTSDSGAGYIKTGNHDDTVITGTGYVTAIHTGNGDDHVDIGTGAAAFVRTGDGDDYVIVSEINPAFGIVLQGGSGIDTLDFSRFSTGVVFSLDLGGAFQNPGAPGGDINTPASGYFSESQFENLVGTTHDDALTGDGNANRLEGGGGKDTLVGLDGNDRLLGGKKNDKLVGGDGNDTLAGGRGNDFLVGGNGADVFEFGANGGRDKVKDFDQGTDILRLDGHVGGFGSLNIFNQGGHRFIEYSGGTIVLAGEAGLALTAADFEFV